jgi:hypothetical protein
MDGYLYDLHLNKREGGILMKKGIKISPKHGLNPSLQQCFFCLESKGVLLLGKLKGDQEAPYRICTDREPCDECRKLMEAGVMCVSVKDGSDKKNPYRTGKMIVLKVEAAKRIFPNLGEARFVFVEDSVWEYTGFPSSDNN